MKFVLFGLSVSSSWGNGHATLCRGLMRALARRGHEVVFFERDQPFYALHRDTTRPEGATLILYPDWESARARAEAEAATADVAMVMSYCPDGPKAAELVCGTTRGISVFYDLDTPVTLAALDAGQTVGYLPQHGLGDFDLVLSFGGGAALDLLQTRLGARRVAPLYGHVDPATHRPARPARVFRGDISYIGTYAADRQPMLERLFVEPARRRPDLRFVLAGSGYASDFPWTDNIYFVRHLPPGDHASFFASSRLTLNLTRAAMVAMGWCPPGRLFEAAACGVPILTDSWPGLDAFFEPGSEVLTAETTEDALSALDLSDAELARVACAARARVLDQHSSDRRAEELLSMLGGATGRRRRAAARAWHTAAASGG